MGRWVVRVGAAVAAVGVGVISSWEGRGVLAPALFTAGAGVALWSAVRFARLLRLPARVVAAAGLLVAAVGALFIAMMGLTLECLYTAASFSAVLVGAAMVLVGSTWRGGVTKRRSHVVVLDAVTIRPAPPTGSFRLVAAFGDVTMDLTRLDVGAGRLFLEVRLLASRCEVLVSKEMEPRVFEVSVRRLDGHEKQRYDDAAIVLQARRAMGSELHITAAGGPPTTALQSARPE